MSRALTTLQSVLEGSDDTPALLLGSGGGTLTRGQLRCLCCQFAASLRASGVQPGDVVTIAEPNTVRVGQGRAGSVSACRLTGLRIGSAPAPFEAAGMSLLPATWSAMGSRRAQHNIYISSKPLQVEYVVAFLGTGLARAVAAPLNQNYRQVGYAKNQCVAARTGNDRQQA